MITNASIEIDAPAETVWAVYADVERWPEWADSVTEIVGLDGPELVVGRRFRIKQPRMPKLVWEVTALDPGVSWVWAQSSPGGSTVAAHEVVSVGAERTLVRQSLEQAGPVGGLVGRLLKRMTRRYLAMECDGLKASSEERHRRADAA